MRPRLKILTAFVSVVAAILALQLFRWEYGFDEINAADFRLPAFGFDEPELN